MSIFPIFLKKVERIDKEFTINARSNMTVEHFKKKVSETTMIHPNDQKLIFAGKTMEDHMTFEDYAITSSVTIHLIQNLRGEYKKICLDDFKTTKGEEGINNIDETFSKINI